MHDAFVCLFSLNSLVTNIIPLPLNKIEGRKEQEKHALFKGWYGLSLCYESRVHAPVSECSLCIQTMWLTQIIIQQRHQRSINVNTFVSFCIIIACIKNLCICLPYTVTIMATDKYRHTQMYILHF